MNRFAAEARVPVCSVCGARVADGAPPLMPGLPPVCGELRCRTTAVDRLRAQQSAARLRTLRAQVKTPGDVIFTPVNRQRTTPRSEARRQSFQRHLDAMIGSVAAEELAPTSHGWVGVTIPGENVELPPETPPAVHRAIATACANCRGWCCRTGSTTAWITRETIQRVQRTIPGTHAEVLRERYLSQLPSRTYADSCVYHTARGCALEPALRSDTCHTFLCDGAHELVHLMRARADLADLPNALGADNIHVAATEGSRVVHVRRVSPHPTRAERAMNQAPDIANRASQP